MSTLSFAKINWNRKVPLRYEADIAVIGGGMAGVSAACAAAKTGAKVILVERFAVTGGNATIGGVANFCGETAGQGQIFDEIISDLEKFQAVAPYFPYARKVTRVFNHEILAVILQELLLRHNVKLLLHTQFVDINISDDGTIKECIVCGKSGPEALRAKQYIDCSGDGQVAHMSGFSMIKGRPEDEMQLPMSLMFFVRTVEEKEALIQSPQGWFDHVQTRSDLPMTSKWPDGPGGYGMKIKIPGFDATDTEAATNAEIKARRRMMEVLDYYQRVEKQPWLLSHCSPQIGIREGRRVVGDYVLQVEDLKAGRRFDDAIARGCFFLDAHKPDDDKRTYVLDVDALNVPPYQIPFRALVPKDGKNLLVAGRCMSADQLALSSARVMPTCSMMGQAAGIAAALSAEKNCNPRDLDYLQIRKLVEERGALLEV